MVFVAKRVWQYLIFGNGRVVIVIRQFVENTVMILNFCGIAMVNINANNMRFVRSFANGQGSLGFIRRVFCERVFVRRSPRHCFLIAYFICVEVRNVILKLKHTQNTEHGTHRACAYAIVLEIHF